MSPVTPKVTVIIPVFKVQAYIRQTLESVFKQTYSNFEVLVIDDESPDNSIAICQEFHDPRLRILHQKNRGLAGARNTGIRHAQGDYLAFLDADDLWHPEKLEKHVAHLNASPEVGISYCPSAFINEQGEALGIYQTPKLTQIDPVQIFCRNPIGNGSAPVIRRQVFEAICFDADWYEEREPFYFDDTFRQSEDIECWLRIALKTQWQFEGIPDILTYYRVNTGGLSANLLKQYQAWERILEKTQTYAPEFIARYGSLARAYQLRYLSRRAVSQRDGMLALQLLTQALTSNPRILWHEPRRTLLTLAAISVLIGTPRSLYTWIEQRAMKQVGNTQEKKYTASISVF